MIHESVGELLHQMKIQGSLNHNLNKVLDLGCGFPVSLFWLHHKFNSKVCVGVDLKEERDIEACINVYDTRIPEDELFDSDLYSQYNRIVKYHMHEEPISKEKFDSTFTFKWNTRVEEFIVKERSNEYDLVQMSCILHFLPYPTRQRVFNHAARCLKVGGLLYVQVRDDMENLEKGVSKIDWREFEEMVEELKPIYGPNQFRYQGRRLDYLGVKRD